MKKNFQALYPFINFILALGILLFDEYDLILCPLLLILNIFSLYIAVKENKNIKTVPKIICGIIIVTLICILINYLYKAFI